MIDRNDAPEGLKRKPHLVATGGRRPTPPEWAKRVVVHFRNKHSYIPGEFERIDLETVINGTTRAGHWEIRATPHPYDILFVEWLP